LNLNNSSLGSSQKTNVSPGTVSTAAGACQKALTPLLLVKVIQLISLTELANCFGSVTNALNKKWPLTLVVNKELATQKKLNTLSGLNITKTSPTTTKTGILSAKITGTTQWTTGKNGSLTALKLSANAIGVLLSGFTNLGNIGTNLGTESGPRGSLNAQGKPTAKTCQLSPPNNELIGKPALNPDVSSSSLKGAYTVPVVLTLKMLTQSAVVSTKMMAPGSKWGPKVTGMAAATTTTTMATVTNFHGTVLGTTKLPNVAVTVKLKPLVTHHVKLPIVWKGFMLFRIL
jgi:hypothetical protein